HSAKENGEKSNEDEVPVLLQEGCINSDPVALPRHETMVYMEDLPLEEMNNGIHIEPPRPNINHHAQGMDYTKATSTLGKPESDTDDTTSIAGSNSIASSAEIASRCFPPQACNTGSKKQEKNQSINTKHCIQDNEKECKG
ncbi:Hypothetical predicted protein, partial [Paramuricea clavata]